jgi:hypothetical protein
MSQPANPVITGTVSEKHIFLKKELHNFLVVLKSTRAFR